MKFINYTYLISGIMIALALSACGSKSRLDISFDEKFEDETVELMSYRDSTIIASTVVKDGKAQFELSENDSLRFPLITQVMVSNHTRAYYVLEPGKAYLVDSLNVAKGTPLNESLGRIMARLDSIEDTEDISLYNAAVETEYNANKDNVLGEFLGVEWLKYADPSRVDSMLSQAPKGFAETPRAKYYINFARLREATAPGKMYTDFDGENENGKPVKLSQYIKPGKYTLIDIFASWCPYCIKEIPDLKSLKADMGDSLEIIGVAVRDLPDDTRSAVSKFDITWPVIYNTGRTPYNIYGFSGIPHHILLDPEGIIISRGEGVGLIRNRFNN